MSQATAPAEVRHGHKDHREPLELATYEVRDVVFGKQTQLAGGVLTINLQELKAELMESGDFGDVLVEIVKPGDDVRIIHILDVVEPRVRVSAPGTDFPGFLSPPRTVGSGRTNRLSGIAIVEIGD